MKLVALVAIFLAALVASAEAVSFTPSATVLDVEYQEPSTNLDGTPVTDLSHVSLRYSLDGGPLTVAPPVPASTPNGGAPVQTTLTVPVPAGGKALVTVVAVAVDQSGNESDPSEPATYLVDRQKPGRPQVKRIR